MIRSALFIAALVGSSKFGVCTRIGKKQIAAMPLGAFAPQNRGPQIKSVCIGFRI